MFDDSNTGSKTSFGDESGRVIWTTKKVEQAFRSFEEGYELKESPFYERKTDYRKGNLVYEYTDEEMAEMRRCAKDIVYFADKYCKVMTDEGYKKIELRDYQKEILLNYKNHRFNILLASRQIGKTITTGIFLVWYMLFNFDRNVLLMTNKGETTIDFDKPVVVQVGTTGVAKSHGKIAPSLAVLLEDLALRGDRQQLFLARIDLKF
jgi:hypothetical protein